MDISNIEDVRIGYWTSSPLWLVREEFQVMQVFSVNVEHLIEDNKKVKEINGMPIPFHNLCVRYTWW